MWQFVFNVSVLFFCVLWYNSLTSLLIEVVLIIALILYKQSSSVGQAALNICFSCNCLNFGICLPRESIFAIYQPHSASENVTVYAAVFGPS